MNQGFKLFSALFFCMILWSCTSPNDIVDYTEDLSINDPEPGSTAGYNEEKNVYFGIYPSLSRQFCTADDLVGDWEVIFEGVNLESIQFKVIDKMIPGMDYSFEPVC